MKTRMQTILMVGMLATTTAGMATSASAASMAMPAVANAQAAAPVAGLTEVQWHGDDRGDYHHGWHRGWHPRPWHHWHHRHWGGGPRFVIRP